jgi:hypothetical protein
MSSWLKVRLESIHHDERHETNRLAGYKQYKTNRKYMARMGNWRDNKDDEIQLDGIGGVNIMVKADVHRSGKPFRKIRPLLY